MSVMMHRRHPDLDALRRARVARLSSTAATPASSSMPTAAPAPSTMPSAPAPAALPTPTHGVSAADLFNMGFEPDSVGQALVSSRGDATKALGLLRSADSKRQKTVAPTPSTPVPEAEEDEDEELALALKLSLESTATTSSGRATSHTEGSHPLWAPPRYLPPEGADALRVIGGKTLSLVEHVEVRDASYAWQKATAFLDTGNQHMTIVDPRFAARHAIYVVEQARASGGGFGQAERWTTLHGVVPGASSRAPCVTIALKMRGEEFVIQAAVSHMGGGHDLLLGVDVLERLFASGFQIGAGSM